MGTHYSNGQDPIVMDKWAKRMAKAITLMMDAENDKRIPVFAYRGMSGISAATALAIRFAPKGRPFVMAYVRKENEVSHGQKVETHWVNTTIDIDRTNVDNLRLCVVDDFICSGDSVKATAAGAYNYLGCPLQDDSLLAMSTPNDGRALIRVGSCDEYRRRRLLGLPFQTSDEALDHIEF